MDDRYQLATLTQELPFGNYFEAEDTFIQRKVQIFRFAPPKEGAPSDWKDIFGECSASLGTISHPGLPIIYEHGIDEEGPFSIRQFMDTTSLNERLIDGGQLSEYEGWELAQQLLEIHDAARTSNNFHGALDPNHIGFITRPSGEKRYSITDYGLAQIHKLISADNAYYGINFLISPEQLKGEELSERSQLYSIGHLIFHALSGGHPWTNVAIDSISEQAELEPISAYNQMIPEAMDQWLAKLIAKDPSQRFASYAVAFEQMPAPIQSAPVPEQTTGTVFTTATAYQSQQATQTTQSVVIPVATPPHKNPVILGVAGAVLLLIIGVIALSGGDEETASATTESTTTEALFKGRIAHFDFESSKSSSAGDAKVQLIPLKRKAEFANKGFHTNSKKSLLIDKNHFFKFPIKDTVIGESNASYTLSFWMLPTTSSDNELSLRSKKPWEFSNAPPVDDDFIKSVEDTLIYGNAWNMITMVFNKSQQNVALYVDGQLVNSSKTDAISTPPQDGFIFIGCNESEESIHITPILIDNFSIWNRELSAEEVLELYRK